MAVAQHEAFGDIMDGRLGPGLERTTQYHVDLADEGKALGVAPVLVDHVMARSIGLVFDDADDLIQDQQGIILVCQQIFVTQRNIFFPGEDRVGRILPHHLGPVDQLFVAGSTPGIELAEPDLLSVPGQFATDHTAMLGGIQGDNSGIMIGTLLPPERDDLLNGIIRHPVIRINAGIELGIDQFIGGIVGGMHPTILLVVITDRNAALGDPTGHQFAGVIGGPIIDDQPAEIPAGLPQERGIEPGQQMRPVVGGGEDGEQGRH